MAVCDICNKSGTGTRISSEDMRKAVFKNGFDPFRLGLVPGAREMMGMLGLDTSVAYNDWKSKIVAQDTSDWNICAGCMATLRPYLEGPPKPTGVSSSRVSGDPAIAALAAARAEQKYGSRQDDPVQSARAAGSGPSVPPGKPAGKSKCFIATAACGAGDAPDVVCLREFRDAVLQRAALGRAAIRLYESASPPIARAIGRSGMGRAIIRYLVVRPAASLARTIMHSQTRGRME
jgi:hypothetical protein